MTIVALAAGLADCSRPPPPAEMSADTKVDGGTYLASISIPLAPRESVASFSIDTWGVDVITVCSIPSGWRITAGSSATPDGILAGEGSLGATWLNDMKPLESLFLLRLYGPVQQADDGIAAPATFKGRALVQTPDDEREQELSYKNVRLVAAERCPDA